MKLPSGIYNTTFAQDNVIIRTGFQWSMLLGFLVILFSLPFIAGSYVISLVIVIGITVISALGLNILTGYCGQISLAQSAFMGVGAYSAAILVIKAGLPFLIALPCAGIMVGIIGLILGAPSLRVKGLYLALATLAAQFILQFVFLRWQDMTGGSLGLTVPVASLGPIVFNNDRSYFYLTMIIVIAMTYFAKRLITTKVGRALIAVRDNDIAAEGMGINPFYYKLMAFFIGCFYAGIAGALWVFYIGSVSVEYYSLWDSVMYLGMIVVGGLGSIAGTIFGVVFFKVLAEFVHGISPMIAGLVPSIESLIGGALPLIMTGLVIMFFLIFEPRGLAHRWGILKTQVRLWPFTY